MTSSGERNWKSFEHCVCVHVCCFLKHVSKSQWAWAPGFACQDLFGDLRRAWGALGAGAVQRSAQHSFLAPAACSPSGSAFRRQKRVCYNRDFCSFLFSFSSFLFPIHRFKGQNRPLSPTNLTSCMTKAIPPSPNSSIPRLTMTMSLSTLL